MNVQVNQNEVERALQEQFVAWADTHKDIPTILADARATAIDELTKNGLPHRRVEAWKYTDLRRLMRSAFPPVHEAAAKKVCVDLEKTGFTGLQCLNIVHVNGVLREDLSDLAKLPEGVTAEPLTDAFGKNPDLFLATASGHSSGRDNVIGDLVSALAGDGLVFSVAARTKVSRPLHFIYINESSEPFAAYRHVLLELATGACVTVLESHLGSDDAYQTCGVTGFDLAEGAELDHIKMQSESDKAQHLSHTGMRLAADSACRSFTLSCGSTVSRNQAAIAFSGSGAYAHVSGATLARDKQHADTTIFVDHAVPACNSEQTYKYVLDDDARGVFQGKVAVQPGAHGTDGRQSSNALLLSDRADMYSKPELEIYNDDVQCAHGSTSGEMDEELLFYLRARGIPEAEARALLVQAFVGSAIETVRNEDIRDAITGAVEFWLKKAAHNDH